MPYLRVKNELPIIPGYSEGAIAYAQDAADAPLNECICYINPEQSGSGDPSPSNVCPITGHTELNLVQKDGNDTVVHTYTTDLGTTVYGGTLDVVSGVLTLTHSITTLLATDYWAWNTSLKGFRKGYAGYSLSPTDSNNMCNILPTATAPTGIGIYYHDSYIDFINLDQLGITDAESWKTVLNNSNGVTFTLPLTTPTTTQLTPQEVKSLLGSNNFYHDCNGDTKITYIRRLDS